MRLNKSDIDRLLIYFFYDKDGIVDDYISYMLEDLKKNVSDIFVVCNGKLSDAGRETFSKYTDNILVRSNQGFDVWAYKEAMEQIGWNRLDEYDEIVLMNFTVMGPVYPFVDMFNTMNDKDIDFWGITQFYKTDYDPFGTMEEGYIPDHIQSHYIAVRKSLINTEVFHEYWDNMPMITGYLDSVSRHEAKFTKYFEKAGYNWEVYTDASDYIGLSHQPAVGMAKKMVADKRCPIFKRRSFMQDYTVVLNESCGQEAVELYEYLDKHTDYNMNLLWDNLLRVENQADLKRNLQFNYILPSEASSNPNIVKDKKIALVMHIHFVDLVDECFGYAMSMPDNADIYITTNTEEKAEVIRNTFSKMKCNKLDVRVVGNKGRDVGPFLVEFREYLDQYDYICHAHDKKAGQTSPGTIGTSFAYKCFENVLKSKEYVENIIETFEKNDRAGLLAPPPPNHADYYITLGLEWGSNFENTVKLANELGINAPMNDKKEPIAPLGSFFWARTDAIKPVFEKEWSYDDFPTEPIADDGTILHAIERIYPFSAQSQGYYPGWIMCDKGAAIEITNLNYMLKDINNIIFFKGLDAGSYYETLYNLSRSYDYANAAKRGEGFSEYAEAKLYIGNSTEGFSENTAVTGLPEEDKSKLVYTFGFDKPVNVSDVRFDPCEYGQVIVRQFKMIVENADGSVHTYDVNATTHNGILLDDEIIFLLDDPQIMIHQEEMLVRKITCEVIMDKNINNDHVMKMQSRINGHKGIFNKIGKKHGK